MKPTARTIGLRNDFHGTEANIRPVLITEGRFAGLYRVSRTTQLRTRKTLCPRTGSGCLCGGTFGERQAGRVPSVINEDSDRSLILDLDIK